MKLVYCPTCGDVVRLVHTEWRMCDCGNSGGQYNKDMMTATVGGHAQVFGIGNYFFNPMFTWFTRTQKRAFRKKYTGQPDSDCWHSKAPDRDTQIITIENPKGPRIRMKIVTKPGAQHTTITIIDRRKYIVAGERKKTWTVPANVKASFKGRKK